MALAFSRNLWPTGLSCWLPYFVAVESSPYYTSEDPIASAIEHPGLPSSNDSNQRTRNQFRPRAPGKGGATSYQLRQYAEATLGGGSLRKVVKLPEGEDENEWLAVNSK